MSVPTLDRDGLRLGANVWGFFRGDDPSVSVLGGSVPVCRFTCGDNIGTGIPQNLREEIDFACSIGAGTLVVHPICLGLVRHGDEIDVDEVRRAAAYAARLGVRLALENVANSIWALDRVLDKVGNDPERTNLGICIDIGHAFLSNDADPEPIRGYLNRYREQVLHPHLHDNRGETDAHLIPGEEIIDWPGVLRSLRSPSVA